MLQKGNRDCSVGIWLVFRQGKDVYLQKIQSSLGAHTLLGYREIFGPGWSSRGVQLGSHFHLVKIEWSCTSVPCVPSWHVERQPFIFVFARQPPRGPGPPHSRGFLDHTQRRTTVGMTPLDESSAHRKDLYVTTHTTLKTDRQPCPPVGFEPTISACERPQTYALDHMATGTGDKIFSWLEICSRICLMRITGVIKHHSDFLPSPDRVLNSVYS
jgi:hypothetical protein